MRDVCFCWNCFYLNIQPDFHFTYFNIFSQNHFFFFFSNYRAIYILLLFKVLVPWVTDEIPPGPRGGMSEMVGGVSENSTAQAQWWTVWIAQWVSWWAQAAITKYPMLGSLNGGNGFLTAVEAESPTSRCQQIFLLRLVSLTCWWLSLARSSRGLSSVYASLVSLPPLRRTLVRMD